MKWKEIESKGDGSLVSDRLLVPKGWIVRTRYYASSYNPSGGRGVSVHHIFVEDPEHTWELE